MRSYKPASPGTGIAFLYALLETYSNITIKGGFGLVANGSWLYGPPNATLTGIYITYYFESDGLLRAMS